MRDFIKLKPLFIRNVTPISLPFLILHQLSNESHLLWDGLIAHKNPCHYSDIFKRLFKKKTKPNTHTRNIKLTYPIFARKPNTKSFFTQQPTSQTLAEKSPDIFRARLISLSFYQNAALSQPFHLEIKYIVQLLDQLDEFIFRK